MSQILQTVLNEILGIYVDVNLKRDAIAIENLREYSEKENSLLFSNPEIAKEWNYEKNGNLRPEHFESNSHKKVWWKCRQGHEWQTAIANRTKGNGCPYCSGQKVLMGYNDLQTINLILANEWNYEKNGELMPSDVTPNSSKIVWWKCSKGHEWQATVVDRKNGRGCPFCAGKKVLTGYNDLQTVNPTLTLEWDYEKNGNLTPENFSANSHEKVWWKCSKGHEWQATIASRNNGRRCPYCSNKSLLQGYNDLATTHPEIAKEWDYNKNGNITPSNVMAGSNNKKYWFVCENGHSYSSTLLNRKKGRGCPVCRKNKVKKTT